MTDPDPAGSVRSGLAFTERLKRYVLTRVLRFPAGAFPTPPSVYRAAGAEGYDDHRKDRTVFNWEQEIALRLLEELPAGSTVLDVPVGTGRFIPGYLAQGLKVVGLDSSPDMLAQAARITAETHGDVTLVEGSATALPFPDANFDALVCFRFLPGKLPLRQARRALREFARVTRGTSYLLLKVGERSTAPSWRDEFSQLGKRPEAELRQILHDAGLVVERIERAPMGPKAVFICRSR
jgi:ubiquinone/menaquinone biosynthesis C-methylase UbiE